jgi:hypothetical protein
MERADVVNPLLIDFLRSVRKPQEMPGRAPGS